MDVLQYKFFFQEQQNQLQPTHEKQYTSLVIRPYLSSPERTFNERENTFTCALKILLTPEKTLLKKKLKFSTFFASFNIIHPVFFSLNFVLKFVFLFPSRSKNSRRRRSQGHTQRMRETRMNQEKTAITKNPNKEKRLDSTEQKRDQRKQSCDWIIRRERDKIRKKERCCRSIRLVLLHVLSFVFPSSLLVLVCQEYYVSFTFTCQV